MTDRSGFRKHLLMQSLQSGRQQPRQQQPAVPIPPAAEHIQKERQPPVQAPQKPADIRKDASSHKQPQVIITPGPAESDDPVSGDNIVDRIDQLFELPAKQAPSAPFHDGQTDVPGPEEETVRIVQDEPESGRTDGPVFSLFDENDAPAPAAPGADDKQPSFLDFQEPHEAHEQHDAPPQPPPIFQQPAEPEHGERQQPPSIFQQPDQHADGHEESQPPLPPQHEPEKDGLQGALETSSGFFIGGKCISTNPGNVFDEPSKYFTNDELLTTTTIRKTVIVRAIELAIGGRGAYTKVWFDCKMIFLANIGSGDKLVFQLAGPEKYRLPLTFSVTRKKPPVVIDNVHLPFTLRVTWDGVKATAHVENRASAEVKQYVPRSRGHLVAGITIGAFAVATSALCTFAAPVAQFVQQTLASTGLPEFLKTFLYPVIIPAVEAAIAIACLVGGKGKADATKEAKG